MPDRDYVHIPGDNWTVDDNGKVTIHSPDLANALKKVPNLDMLMIRSADGARAAADMSNQSRDNSGDNSPDISRAPAISLDDLAVSPAPDATSPNDDIHYDPPKNAAPPPSAPVKLQQGDPKNQFPDPIIKIKVPLPWDDR